MGIYQFYSMADELRNAGDGTSQYHRIIVRVCISLGLLGVLLGITFWILAAQEAKPDEFKKGKDIQVLVLAPVLFAAMLIFLGAIGAVAVAPTSFFYTSAGQKWMATFGGTKNPAVTRAFCGVILALVFGSIGLFAYLVWAKQHP